MRLLCPLLLIAIGCSPEPQPMPCNGQLALCDRPLNEVAFAGSHNSMASVDAGFTAGANANHQSDIAQQLRDGVRLLNLDIYEEGGELVLCHGPCGLGQTPHDEILSEIHSFLADNPDEILVVTYEDYVPLTDLADAYEAADLARQAYVHTGDSWPTLAQLREADTRIFIAVQSSGDAPPILHNLFSVVWDTPYSFDEIADFNCDLNRGERSNPMLQVNHWVGTPLGLPDADRASQINTYDVLYGRLEDCQAQTGFLPNFVMVDFYEQGDLFEAIDAINGL